MSKMVKKFSYNGRDFQIKVSLGPVPENRGPTAVFEFELTSSDKDFINLIDIKIRVRKAQVDKFNETVEFLVEAAVKISNRHDLCLPGAIETLEKLGFNKVQDA